MSSSVTRKLVHIFTHITAVRNPSFTSFRTSRIVAHPHYCLAYRKYSAAKLVGHDTPAHGTVNIGGGLCWARCSMVDAYMHWRHVPSPFALQRNFRSFTSRLFVPASTCSPSHFLDFAFGPIPRTLDLRLSRAPFFEWEVVIAFRVRLIAGVPFIVRFGVFCLLCGTVW
jgi:hypothetical protein